MDYGLTKQKLPRDFSYPLKRNTLDAALMSAGITQIHAVYYWVPKSGGMVVCSNFCGEERVGWAAAGQSSITIYAVPGTERQTIEQALLTNGLTRLCAWLRAAEDAGNTWRGTDHSIVFSFTKGSLSSTTT
jgi:hypothetical protein